ncbi:MAG: translation initiation factor IF-2 subunit gamma [Candidatus Aenigmarchaeota archaeon]|nr:translation initiation factor IF-2 subunit gamma [Candidatus Aenigmarchaeota archaeon]MDW8149172.1 translation initiation factor IF-2 subunit gamma [Candidatus Aenigmarchaeota archaeon]
MKIDEKLISKTNVGVFGHVGHGKSTLVNAITGISTLRYSEEIERGITIKLGYADARIYKCKSCEKYSTNSKCPYCFSETEIIKTISFVDSPGHESLMSVAITGASIINGAIMIIAANEKCPRPQTREHLIALQAAGIEKVVFAQNKIDIVSKERALESYEEIKKFLKGSIYENSPIIPISASQRINIDKILEFIANEVPEININETKNFKMYVVRSFDINKPGISIENIKGGVLGGSIICGKIKRGDEIRILPGIKIDNKYKPLETYVENIRKSGFDLEEASSGGLVGLLTSLDPALTKADNLAGSVVIDTKRDFEIEEEAYIKYKLFEKVMGIEENRNVEPIKIGENLLLNIGVVKNIGKVINVNGENLRVKFSIPMFFEQDDKVTILRLIDKKWRLIGYGYLFK